MKNLKNFKSKEITSSEASSLKGGNFCEWYISQRAAGAEQNAEILMQNVDPVMVANGNQNFI